MSDNRLSDLVVALEFGHALGGPDGVTCMAPTGEAYLTFSSDDGLLVSGPRGGIRDGRILAESASHAILILGARLAAYADEQRHDAKLYWRLRPTVEEFAVGPQGAKAPAFMAWCRLLISNKPVVSA